jgi:DNA-binding MarR family transcriptional regulator
MTKKPRKNSPSLEGSAYQNAQASPGFLFWKAFNIWNKLIRAEIENLGLTQAQYSILATISYLSSANSNISQQDIANHLSMDKMMVSDVTKTLEKKLFLKRQRHPTDGRAFCLHLTPQARKILATAIPAVESVDRLFFEQLQAPQLKLFSAALSALIDSAAQSASP